MSIREEPFFRKCCFCIPLQSCLHLWGGFKAVADLALITFLILLTILLTSFSHGLQFDKFGFEHSMVLLIFVLLFDFVFMVVLSVGLCKKDLRTLQVFFYYSLYMLFVGIFFTCAVSVYLYYNYVNRDQVELVYVLIACGLLNTGLDCCIILTLKSEMIKLRNKQQYGFVVLPIYKTEVNEAG